MFMVHQRCPSSKPPSRSARLLALCLWCGALFAQDWGEPVLADDITNRSVVAVDAVSRPDGGVVVAWVQAHLPDQWLQVRERDASGQWSASETVLKSDSSIIDLQLHRDDGDGVLLSWIVDPGDRIERVHWMRRDSAGVWSEPAVLVTPKLERGVRHVRYHRAEDGSLTALVVMDDGFNHGASYSRYYAARFTAAAGWLDITPIAEWSESTATLTSGSIHRAGDDRMLATWLIQGLRLVDGQLVDFHPLYVQTADAAGAWGAQQLIDDATVQRTPPQPVLLGTGSAAQWAVVWGEGEVVRIVRHDGADWGEMADLHALGTDVSDCRVVADGAGGVLATWLVAGDIASARFDAGLQMVGSVQSVAATGDALQLRVIGGADGAITVMWKAGTLSNGVLRSRHRGDSGWGPVVELSAGEAVSNQRMSGEGTPVASWRRWQDSMYSAWIRIAEPASSALRLIRLSLSDDAGPLSGIEAHRVDTGVSLPAVGAGFELETDASQRGHIGFTTGGISN